MKSEGQASGLKDSSFRPTSKSLWIFFLVFSIIPFVLRLGIDGRATQQQAFAAIYRDFRWSAPLRNLPVGSEIIFERTVEKDIYQDLFKNELQKDFKLVEVGPLLRVRGFFEESAFLRGRFEVFETVASAEPFVFFEEVRMSNNGILLGLWLGILFYLMGRSLTFSLGITVLSTLFWFSHWNFLSVPESIYDFFKYLGTEVKLRFQLEEWRNAWDFSRALEVLALVWALVVVVPLVLAPRLRHYLRKNFRLFLLLSLLWEPLLLFASSRLAEWSTDAHWWKAYLGSFVFRFILLSLVFFGFLRKDFWDIRKKVQVSTLGFRYSRSSSVFPLLFLFCGGWFWVNSLFPLDSGNTLLRLKAFLVSFLVAFFMGSRFLSLTVSVLVISLHLPPTKGHWETAHLFGYVFDASLLGYLLSPAKGFHPVFLPVANSHRAFMSVVLMSYVLGVFLTAVGVPFLVSWMAIALALWTYNQISNPQAYLERGENLTV